jgi:hypothetical protein
MEHVASLTIRTLVAFPLAYVGGYLGMILGSFLIPSINREEFLPLLLRVLMIGFGVTAGVSVSWLSFMLEWPKRTVLAAAIFLGASTGGLIAYFASEELTGNSDFYILVREITHSTILGTVIAALLIALLMGMAAPRRWRS